MYFVITPPEATVERGWKRGLERGRYKSVEDFLGHSVEAYEGIPKLLFKWLSHNQPKFIFEFFVNIERYQKINIKATTPAEVYSDTHKFVVERNLEFLKLCLSQIESVQFIDPNSNTTYLSSSNGCLKVEDANCLALFSLKSNDYQSLFKHLLL
jgi:hypothetical protein